MPGDIRIDSPQRLVAGDINDIVKGESVVLTMYDSPLVSWGIGVAKEYKGLRNQVYIPRARLFVMDNDVPFYHWHYAARKGMIKQKGISWFIMIGMKILLSPQNI